MTDATSGTRPQPHHVCCKQLLYTYACVQRFSVLFIILSFLPGKFHINLTEVFSILRGLQTFDVDSNVFEIYVWRNDAAPVSGLRIDAASRVKERH